MTRKLVFAYPGDLQLKTGGYAYDRKVLAGLRDRGWEIALLPLGAGFPAPTPDMLAAAQQKLGAIEDGSLVLIDGLAFGVLDEWATRDASRLRIVALVHHPLALETGLSSDRQALLKRTERRALGATRHVIVTSPMTRRELIANYGLSLQHLTVALPGTAPGARARLDGTPAHILSVGTLLERKGHDVLIRALFEIRDLEWTASIVGSQTLDQKTAQALKTLVIDLGLTDRIDLAGECEDTRALMAKADIFALASRYEGYGMVFAEALSHGLPIIACDAGAVPEVVPDDAGILVPVDDVMAFAHALRLMVINPAERQKRGEAAFAAGCRLPQWHDTAEIISSVLETL
ncbi:glycosyltransferase family 4 protein (plasmid) [Peteryoungia desertarenae]|uniref:Glycosyltransferase family 4 protein n=1 Tax=Peteryoungia desertarenae TaxID=1813451 RepID=A0ABX6QT04_9HYPH|nr:glycosyltransferase family 4 protein [Peteryoungia desertarenae]QLF71660.1 glycosyltransferase family 4 protein [Peteryoungia desertarenae]